MDSGYIAPGENHAQALEDNYDVRRNLTPEQVVGLMDQLLCHEVRFSGALMARMVADINADGVAYGSSSLTNTLYVNLHRQVAVASAEDHRGRPVRSRAK